ncbi:DUF99 family protein [Candidatus Bathyarchaeota archaeon]|nr:DUF99 family protein [Candidatus Bathyarchaeota archaeon]
MVDYLKKLQEKLNVESIISIGVDDGKLPPRNSNLRKTLLVAVKLKGFTIKNVFLDEITIDSLDVTSVLTNLLKGKDFNLIFLSGVSFAGFNLIDVEKLFDVFNKPIIVVAEEKPNNLAVKKALKLHFKDWVERWKIVRKLGRLYRVKIDLYKNPLYFEVFGIRHDKARKIIKSFSLFGKAPEPVRIARIIARGLSDY